MRALVKGGVVAGGYAAALLVAAAAVAVRVASTSDPVSQASSGMHAFGDLLLFVGVFGVLAVVPTGAALFFLRPYPRFWSALAALGLVVAASGLAAAVLFTVGRHAAPPSPIAEWAGLSILRILVAPLLALAFLVCAVFSPRRGPRLAFLAGTAAEAAVSAYGGLVWFVPMLLSRP